MFKRDRLISVLLDYENCAIDKVVGSLNCNPKDWQICGDIIDHKNSNVSIWYSKLDWRYTKFMNGVYLTKKNAKKLHNAATIWFNKTIIETI